jgi:hypothetical protein
MALGDAYDAHRSDPGLRDDRMSAKIDTRS